MFQKKLEFLEVKPFGVVLDIVMLMELSQLAGYLAGITYVISAGLYTLDVAKERVTVSIASYFMFTLINASQLVALISEDLWAVVPFTFVGFISSALIFISSLRNGKIYFKLMDKIALGGAMVGFIIWQLTNDPALNIYVLSITNLTLATPIIVKTFKHPNYETARPWRVNLLASSFLLLTINSAAVVVWIVPAREFLASLLINIGIARKKPTK